MTFLRACNVWLGLEFEHDLHNAYTLSHPQFYDTKLSKATKWQMPNAQRQKQLPENPDTTHDIPQSYDELFPHVDSYS